MELLHTASLVHDDINDQSNLRRGSETANARWGPSLALLIGDFVFVRLLGLIAGFDPEVIRILADCCTSIVEGEAQQMIHANDLNLTEEGYLDILSRKTASLIAACGQLGGLLAEGTREQVETLRSYGQNLGMAFQIRDDTLDLLGTSDELGKPTGSDLYHGKVDLTSLYAIRHSVKARETLTAKNLTRVIDMFHDTGAFQYAMQRAGEFVEQAQRSLDILPSSEAKTELSRLADFSIIRVK